MSKVILALMLSVKKSNWLTEGEHLVTISKVEEEQFKDGSTAISLTFTDNSGRSHNQYYPITGFRTFDVEDDAKVPDALTDEERASSEFTCEEDRPYALRIATKNEKTGKLTRLAKPVRVVSEAKSAAALAIIERLAGAFGFEEKSSIDVNELEGEKGMITLKKVQTPDGMFNRVVSFRAAVEQEANAEKEIA